MVSGWNWSTDLQRLMEERRDLEGGETQVSAPGWNWHVNLATRMEVRWYMEGSDASILESGFRWDRTCMELRHILKPGWVWDGGCLNLRCNFADLDGGETYIFNPGWAWDGAWVELRYNLRTWMEVRCHQDGGEMEIYGRRLRWGATWMERRGESTSLHGGETTWPRVRWDQDWAETNVLRPESCDGIMMDMGFNYRDLDICRILPVFF